MSGERLRTFTRRSHLFHVVVTTCSPSMTGGSPGFSATHGGTRIHRFFTDRLPGIHISGAARPETPGRIGTVPRKGVSEDMIRNRALAACAAAGLAAAAVPATASATPVITMSGSTSVAPLAALLAKAYYKHNHIKFKIAQGGSDIGVADVAAGRVTIGNSSRDPKPTDPGGIVFNKI